VAVLNSEADTASRLEPIYQLSRALDPVTRYKLLLDLNNAIVSQTTPEKLFQSIAKEIRKILSYDRCCINIYDAVGNTLNWFAAADGVAIKSMDDSSRSLDEAPVAREVITSRKPFIMPNMSVYAHWKTIKLMRDAGLFSTLAFPLIVRNDMLGSLHFSFREMPQDLPNLVEFLEEISGQVAVAVDNMLTHNKVVGANKSLLRQKDYLLRHTNTQYHPENFYYSSPVMRKMMREVEVVANSDASVLITGETGTGKDHIARYIHHLSARRDALFVKVNCPALVESLFETELFGHTKGAFTGAEAKRVGRFEMADGGTVFLDEIGELPPQLQAKLLHVLQDRRFERVGDSRPVEISFRVIAATNMDLKKAISEKSFRADLFYRLNTVSFHVPPLRERIGEIEPLVHHLTQLQACAMNRVPPVFSQGAIEALERHTWPGNIRELRNIIERLIITSSATVTRSDIESVLDIGEVEIHSTPMNWSAMERAHLIKVLRMTKGVVGGRNGAATLLGMPKSTLQYRLSKHELTPRNYLNAHNS